MGKRKRRSQADAPLKLNLGCGRFALEGYENIDRVLGSEVYPLTDYADESVDEVRASHILEHFPHGQVGEVLHEWARVLKPGGWLKVAVPDMEWIAREYLAGHDINVQGYVMGGQENEGDYHKTIFDKTCLSDALHAVGLVDVQRWRSELPDCASYDCSLNLMARKPIHVPKLNIGCAMSVPRLGFQDNFFCWAAALMPYGIVPVRYEGCFWGQCIERVMTDLAQKHDWILTVDYDSIFTREQVGALIRLVYEHPEVDALAPIQMARGRQGAKPLLVIRDDEGNVRTRMDIEHFEKPLLKVETAHFGLTLIKSEKLLAMPHPWFRSEPAPDGTWGEGRIDDDIYFWHRWRDAGHTAYIANRVTLGHAELMISWPNGTLDPIHQYPSDFFEKGPPEGIWE